MTQPIEMTLNLPMTIPNGVISSTSKVWEILVASKNGNISKVKELAAETPELVYAQYNYTPPIHFAVREGHTMLVEYLLAEGAHDPNYKIYPFLDSLTTLAEDRGLTEIVSLLNQYAADNSNQKFKGDNGEIHYDRTSLQNEFQDMVDKQNYERVKEILNQHPDFAKDETYFWGEGVMTMPSKTCNWRLLELLISYGATVPSILKWGQFYYFEKYEAAQFLLERGMNPNTKSWQEVTLLHDMAQKGDIPKAELLLKHGADLHLIDDEYCSTPLGMAARWGHAEMVELLLRHGADPNEAGASWAMPLAWSRKKDHKQIEVLLLAAGAK